MTTENFLPRSFLPTGIIFPIEEVYLYLWHDHIKSTDNSKVVMLNELSIRPQVQLLSSLNSSNNRLHYTKALNFEYIQCSIDFKIFFDLHGNFDEDRFYIKVLIAFCTKAAWIIRVETYKCFKRDNNFDVLVTFEHTC